MSHQVGHAEQDSALPPPELNPLVNPLLAQHMGRWAEVYFTAAPENRDEAVLALLRELSREATTKPAASIPKSDFPEPDFAGEKLRESLEVSPHRSVEIPPKPRWIQAIEEISLVCESCGQRVPQTQRFCGMCGAPMRTEEIGPSHTDFHEEEQAEAFDPVDVDNVRETVFSFGGNVPSTGNPVLYRYRIYVVGALVVLLAALGIMAYRSTQELSGRSRALPQVPPRADSQPAAQPAAKSDTPGQATAGTDGTDGLQAFANGKVETKTATQKSTTPSPAPVRISPIARNDQPATPNAPSGTAGGGNGSEELLVAERYLNGAHGSARDTREAARWLWQAVSKQNAAASVLLSDLYLRGDGVPKSCDQARLLLTAAARKRVPQATEKLRNLVRSGCP